MQKDFSDLFKKTMNALDKEQSNYDHQTNHSKEGAVQTEWERKIDEELRAYQNFAATSISFSFE